MRISTNTHKHTVLPGLSGMLLLVCLLATSTASSQQEFKLTSEDMVAIRADHAWEDVQPNIVHFQGNFEMRVRDWLIKADTASLYGDIDDPDRLELNGSPARINIANIRNNLRRALQGQAREIIYDRASDSIQLIGGAHLAQGKNLIQADIINYDIKTDRVHTTGNGGVQINVDTQGQEKADD